MAIDSVRAYLAGFSLADRILEFDVSSATVELAAEALGCEPCRIAKSMAFLQGETAVLVVAAGDARIDNTRYKQRFGMKAKMIQPEQVEALVGHGVGGVCPFALREGVTVWLDESLRRFDTVYPAGGSSSSAVRLTIPELEKSSGASGWVDVCRGWRGE